MLSPKELSVRIREYIEKDVYLDEKRERHIEYALEVIIGYLYEVIVILILSAFLDIFWYTVFLMFSFSYIKTFSRGVHSSSYRRCFIISTVLMVGGGLFAKYLDGVLNQLYSFVLLNVVFVYCLYLLYTKAPVDTPKNPIRNEARKKKMRLYSIYMLVGWYLLFLSVLMFLPFFKGLVLASAVGVFIQSLTLSNIGQKILYFLDDSLSRLGI